MEPITVYSTPGQTLYLFPDGQSLADWTTYRVLLVEGTGANTGRYTASVDTAYGYRWTPFSGAAQPTDWNQALSLKGFDLVILEILAALKADAELGTGAGGAANADEVKARVRAGLNGDWEDELGNRTTLEITDPL